MTPLERIASRSNACDLLSRIYLDGVRGEVYRQLRHIPEWHALCPEPFDADQAAARYQRVFGFNVPPYSSVFLEPEGYLGGSVSESVQSIYRTAGLQIKSTDVMPDHIGLELAYLAHLGRLEGRCLEEGDESKRRLVREEINGFVEEHLLMWLPMFVQTLQEQGDPLFAEAATLTWEVVIDHLTETLTGAGGIIGEEPPGLFEQGRGRLMDAAEQLVRPIWCGFYLSRYQMGELGRQLDLPVGFIERKQMMSNLLHAALRYEAMPRLVGALEGHVEKCRSYYESLKSESLFVLEPILSQLIRRLDHALRVLAQLEDARVPDHL